ncbi:MAG TPA: alkaline phosphatase family protein [Gaiellales bacterium]
MHRPSTAFRVVLAVAAVLAVSLAATAAGSPSIATAATNLVSNGTFEGSGAGSLTGWGGSNGSLSLVAGNGGGHAAKLAASSGASSMYAYTTSKPVKSAAAGAGYQLSGDVQSAVAGQTVCLILKEIKAGTSTTVASAQSCLTPTAAWQSFPAVSYTVKTSGDSLTVNVQEKPTVSGATYSMDNIVLQTGTGGGGGGDTQAPSVPQNVSALANGPTSVTVTWSPSSDNVGVTGYDIFRNGAKLKTVGQTTTFTDTTAQPNTSYAYTVDAFDAVPNTSAQSAPSPTVTTPTSGGGGGGTGPAEPIIMIMMENKHYTDIVGSSSAPYIQSLIAQGTLFTNYEAAPGSLPDYLANTSGLTGSTSGSNNIFNQLQGLGVSWGEYEEAMPSTCFTGADTGEYKKEHNPAVYYNDITSNPSACANVLPFTAFDPTHLRAFSYVVPDLADDMHDGASRGAEIAAGDAWLSAHVPAMLNAGAEVILTWDEGSASDEHVATIAIGGTAAVGAKDATAYTHPGLLAGLEDAWGLPLLNAAQTATPLPIH